MNKIHPWTNYVTLMPNKFLSIMKPHNLMSAQTLAHRIKILMAKAGIDTSVFSQHSTHSALASWHGKTKAMSAKQIYKAGKWLSLTTTIGKFYQRE